MGDLRWSSMPAHDPDSGSVNVVVETPGGSRNKFKYDDARGVFLLYKILPVGAAFPFDFGFVPGTRGEDGDPLDVMIVGDEPTFVGCLVTVRLLGAIEAQQTEKGRTVRNDRLIGAAVSPKIRPAARSLNDLPAGLMDQIEHFFVAYNHAEGRQFVPLARRGPRAATGLVEQGIRDFDSVRSPSRPRRSGRAAKRR